MNFAFPQGSGWLFFGIAVTILLAVVTDYVLRSLIKVPKTFDSRRTRTYVTVLRNGITVAVYAVALNIILAQLGINITPLLASAGIIGLAIGFGAKSVIEDLIAGIFLLSEDSIALGDYVKIDDLEGKIERIGLRTLSIRTDDGALASIPNGMVKKLINYSRHKAQIHIAVPVKADVAIDAVMKLIEETLTKLKKEQEKHVFGATVEGIDQFASGGNITLMVTITTSSEHRHEIAYAFRLLVKQAFEKQKIALG